MEARNDPDAAAVNAVVASAIDAIRSAGATVVEVTIPDLAAHIEATSQYVARTKHDINAFMAARPRLGGRTLQDIVATKQYHPELDLIDAVMEGPDEPEEDPDYFRRFAAREAFTRAVVNVMAANDPIRSSTQACRCRRRRWKAERPGRCSPSRPTR